MTAETDYTTGDCLHFPAMPPSFSERLLAWYDRAGRKDLPWQLDKTPYRVWVSEVMLQQTQARTVIPYFERFVERFPSPQALADAPSAEVLKHWAGLGYYARARNLHLAARRVRERFHGEVPQQYEDLISLPGVGRSTAGAILALCFNQPFPILDGNVKRVLARHQDVAGWPGEAAVSRRLWALSEASLPDERVSDYTQAIMDLGAVTCTRNRPRCDACPVSRDCKARIRGRVAERPARRPRRPKPTRSTVMLIVTHGDQVLLQRRPATGVWGGLLCLPEVERLSDVAAWCRRRLGFEEKATRWDGFAHEFTHFKLNVEPVAVHCRRTPLQISERDEVFWCKIRDAQDVGVPAPVRKLLAQLDRAVQNRGNTNDATHRPMPKIEERSPRA